MLDFREMLLQEIEQNLVRNVGQEIIKDIMSIVTLTLSNYEVTERCTDLVPAEDENQKLIKRYCACLAIDGKSEKTIAQYKRSLIRMNQIVYKPFIEYGVYDIRYYLALEKQKGLSNISLENTRSYISAFFKWMLREGFVDKNIMDNISSIKSPVEVKEPFSDIEIDTLRSGCRNLKERALIEILLSTGIRANELSMMDINDIDFSTMIVHVRHGKGSKERITYMSNICRKHLAAYLNNRKDNNVSLFTNYRHERLNTGGIRSILGTISKRACVQNVHLHRFRRTFATGLSARGMDVQEIQKLLGHTNLNTTMKYVKINDAQIQASYKKYIA